MSEKSPPQTTDAASAVFVITTPPLTIVSTERDADLGREACAALARGTWFAEYLERKFAAVRVEERERCAKIAEDDPTGTEIARRIRCA